jgi:CheY-like chemotaxis protein
MIVLDLTLEDGSGEEVLKFTKENHPDTKVLVVTGDRSEASLKKLFELGTDDYITKPVDELIFRSKARSILSSRYVSPLNFLGRREGLGMLTVHTEIKIKRLDEVGGTLISPFHVLPGGLIFLTFNGIRFQFRVAQYQPIPSEGLFLLEGQVVKDTVENAVEFRRAIMEFRHQRTKKAAA